VALPARLNPFAVEGLHDFGYRDPSTGEPADLAPLLERFDALGRRAAVVGPEGTGKSTLLGSLAPRLAAAGTRVARIRVREGGRVEGPVEGGLPESGGLAGVCLLVDGADALPRRTWRRLARDARRADGLLVTIHRPGLLPTLVETATSPALLARLVSEVLGRVGEPEPGSKARTLPPPAELLDRHGGNVRHALLELYDLHAGR
jgi:hypothetical protein